MLVIPSVVLLRSFSAVLQLHVPSKWADVRVLVRLGSPGFRPTIKSWSAARASRVTSVARRAPGIRFKTAFHYLPHVFRRSPGQRCISLRGDFCRTRSSPGVSCRCRTT